VNCSPQLRIIENATELAGLRDEWDALLSDSSADCLFLTWEWMEAWWRHLGGDRTLHVIEVRDGRQLIGIAPFTSRHGRLELVGTGTVGSDYLDVIVRPEFETPVLDAIARHVEATKLNLRLSHILAGSLIYRLADRLKNRGYRMFDRKISVCPYISLKEHSWESFLSSLGPRHRENVRRKIRKLPAAARFEQTATKEELRANLPILIELHNRRWDSRGGSDALQDAPMHDFHKEFTERALERGWLRLSILKVADQPVAAVYAFARNGKYLYYQAGIAPEHAGMSLGLVALALSVRSAFDEGAVEYDLLHGNEEYKSLWARETRDLHLLEAYPPSLRGSLTLHSHRVLRAAKTMARYVIAR
jgi:CelD/BcsL family acetyltransferase involved in cellulose biosynthesis